MIAVGLWRGQTKPQQVPTAAPPVVSDTPPFPPKTWPPAPLQQPKESEPGAPQQPKKSAPAATTAVPETDGYETDITRIIVHKKTANSDAGDIDKLLHNKVVVGDEVTERPVPKESP